MISFLTKLLPSSWLLYLLGSVALIGVGVGVGWTVQGWRLTGQLEQVRHDFVEYQHQVLLDIQTANQKYQQELSAAQERIRLLDRSQVAARSQRERDSQVLTEPLRNPSNVPNPLSKSTLDYLDKLKRYQLEQDHH